jgi:hypothetical protein
MVGVAFYAPLFPLQRLFSRRRQYVSFLLSVPGRAMHVHIHIINSTAIKVAWGPPRFEEEMKSGTIRAYVVETRGLDKEGKPSGFVTRTRIPQGTKLTVTGLEPATFYEVRIWGVTRRGNGDPSAPIKVKTFRSGMKL